SFEAILWHWFSLEIFPRFHSCVVQRTLGARIVILLIRMLLGFLEVCKASQSIPLLKSSVRGRGGILKRMHCVSQRLHGFIVTALLFQRACGLDGFPNIIVRQISS